MSEDLTNKLPKTESCQIILTAIENLERNVRGSIDNLVTWIGSIDLRLKNLEQKVEERLHDTRPIWSKVVADIAHLQADVTHLQTDVTNLQAGQQQLVAGQESMRSDIRDLNASVRGLDERLRRIEVNRSL